VGDEGVAGVGDDFALAGGAVGAWVGVEAIATATATATAKAKAKTKTNAGVSPLRRAMRLRDSGRDDASYVHMSERAD
jgi:hypothetical protein